MGERETLFKENLPEFTDVQAEALYRRFGEVISVNGREGPIDSFLLMFVTEKSDCGPLCLNPVVARELCKLLIANGYGPPA